MPTEFWYPISGTPHDLPSGWDSFTLGAGANKNVATRPGGGRAGPMTHDESTTYISAVANGAAHKQAVNVDWPGPILSLTGVMTAGARTARAGGSSPQRYQHMVGPAGANGTLIWSSNENSGGYVTHGPFDISNAATYRPGGGSWLVSDFADDKTMFTDAYEQTATGPTVFFTSMWGTLGFVPPLGGGFVFLLGLAGAMALPHVGRFPDFVSFRRYLDWRARFHPRHTRWAPGEAIEAWREIRTYRWPTHFFPA